MRGFNVHDITRDEFMLTGPQARHGYDWWWHSFTAYNEKTGEAKPFFIEFFICDPELGGEEPVLGQLPENRENHRRPSYLMVNVGAWGRGAVQLHRFFGIRSAKIHGHAPFSVEAEDCFLSETETHGSVLVTPEQAAQPELMCGAGEMRWELKINKLIAFNVGYGADKLMRSAQVFEMFWHAEGMKTEYSGFVELNGERYLVSPETSFGYADKNWGKDFTSPWVWLASCDLVSNITGKRLADSAFDIGGGCPKVGKLALHRKLLSAFWYEGTPYEFNFSKFWTMTKTEFSCTENETQIIWHVDQSTPKSRMVTDITCEKADMLLINYESPSGEKRHTRLYNGGNGRGTVKLYSMGELVDDIRCEKVGCEYGEYDAEGPYGG